MPDFWPNHQKKLHWRVFLRNLIMLYHLPASIIGIKFAHLMHYVSVRIIAALMSSLTLSFIFGGPFLSWCKVTFLAKPREFTPANHQAKGSVPTMGGLLIVGVFLTNTLLWNNLLKLEVWLLVGCILGFGAIGFYDDWQKVFSKKGIPSWTKFFLQLTMASIITGAWFVYCQPQTHMFVPIFKSLDFNIGLLLIPWSIFIMIGASNAVNLTDGLDGLATGPLITSLGTYGLIAYLTGHKIFAGHLHLPFTNTSELAICAASLIGALIGFLWYNTYPAQIFMGDVGALALGAGLGFIALATRQELLLPIVGGIFVIETLSVIIQMTSYKLRGRRFFLMAPIHHHFELAGWNEAKITIRFWIISFILALITLLFLKIR